MKKKVYLKEGLHLYDEKGNKYLTEKGDYLLERDTSISELTDTSLVDKLVQFIRMNPFPVDGDLHAFAKENNIEPDKMEQYAYGLLSVILCGGKSKGYVVEDIDDNSLDIGFKIEEEHVVLDDNDNDVVKEMQRVFRTKIMYDHLAENPNYYIEGVDFVKELEQEQNKNEE